MEEIQIQIVNYKTKTYLLKALESLSDDLANTQLTYSVLVLENASGDDLSDISTLFPSLHVGIRTSETNLGFGSGHNVLAQEAKSKYLFILNPDIKFIEPNTVERLIEAMKKSNVEVVGPRLLTKENKTQRWDHGEIEGFRAQFAMNSGGSYWKECTKPTPAAWVSGAAFIIETSWFKKLSGFDKEFFLYKEEEDLCWRLRGKRGKVLYIPTITIFHEGGVVANKSEHMQKSVALFLRKHFQNRFGYHLYRFLNNITN